MNQFLQKKNWNAVKKSELEKKIKVSELQFDKLISTQLTQAQGFIDLYRHALSDCIEQYEKKESLKEQGYRLKYFYSDGAITAEIDEEYELIKNQRWSK